MRRIAGYEVLEELGRGAFGEVLKARDPRTDRLVLLKSMPNRDRGESSPIRRFKQLAQVLARIDNPGVVKLLDAVEEDGVPYLVFEYVEGQNLQQRLREGPPPSAVVAQIVESLARSVHAGHQQGLLHRDLKPGNVLLGQDGTPRVLDFGLIQPESLADPDSGLTQSGTIIGTPAYMAPEQALGDPRNLTPATDVYGLGTILYETLTGRPPFQGADMVGLLMQSVQGQPTPPHDVNPSVDPSLEAICLKALRKNPKERYSSAEEMAEELRRYRAAAVAPPPAPSPFARRRDEDDEDAAPRKARRRAADDAPPPPAPAMRPSVDRPKRYVDDGAGGLIEVPAPPPSGEKLDRPARSAANIPAKRSAGAIPSLRPHRERRKGKPQSPTPRVDAVVFTVTAPHVMRPGSSYLIDVWAHFEKQRSEILSRAIASVGDPVRSKSKGPIEVARGTVLTVRLHLEDAVIDEPEDTILWQGEIGNATFPIRVAGDATAGNKRGTASILVGGLQVARIHFVLEVGQRMGRVEPMQTQEERHKKAFASYASEDRDQVLARIQGIQKAAPGLEIFLDVFSLRSGQYWEQELWKVIPANDVFYLFWSSHARLSQWVEKEWRCALQTRGLDFIDPVPLAPPTEVPPPAELAGKHFNDWVLAFMHNHRPRTVWQRVLGMFGLAR